MHPSLMPFLVSLLVDSHLEVWCAVSWDYKGASTNLCLNCNHWRPEKNKFENLYMAHSKVEWNNFPKHGRSMYSECREQGWGMVCGYQEDTLGRGGALAWPRRLCRVEISRKRWKEYPVYSSVSRNFYRWNDLGQYQ